MKLKKEHISTIGAALLVGLLLLFVWLCTMMSYLLSAIITVAVSAWSIRAFIKLYYKLHYKKIRNNFLSIHVAGTFPRKMKVLDIDVKPGAIPFLKKHSSMVKFVPHEDVHRVASDIRADIEKAYKGVPEKDRHPVKVYTYTFREATKETNVFESWWHYEGEGDYEDNSYPARIILNVEKVVAKEMVEQQEADPDYFRRIVMKQKVTSKVVGDNVFEW